MPDPRDFIDGDYTYVRGHVRRRKRRATDPWLVFFFLLIVGIVVWLVVQFVCAYWFWLVVVIAVILAILMIYFWRRRRPRSVRQGIRDFDELNRIGRFLDGTSEVNEVGGAIDPKVEEYRAKLVAARSRARARVARRAVGEYTFGERLAGSTRDLGQVIDAFLKGLTGSRKE